MTTPKFNADLAAVAGLSRANDIVSALSNFGPDFSALSALSKIDFDTRPALLDALATIDVSAFKHAHLGALAESFSALDVTPTLLGGLAANAGIADTLATFAAATHAGLGAGLAAQFGEQMLASVDTRDWLLMAATTAAPKRDLISARPLTAFDRYLDHLPLADVDDERARTVFSAGRTHGFTVDALVAHDALMSPMDADELEEVIEVVQGEVVEPWLEARVEVAGHLRSRLSAIDPKLAELYVGAWDALGQARPGYLEASCHLANEALGRVMHQLAPDDQVRAWASLTGVPAKEVESSGRLTRKIRLRYILRDASRDERRLLLNDVEAISTSTEALVNRFNAGKHASTGTNVTLRANLMTLEGVLTRILN